MRASRSSIASIIIGVILMISTILIFGLLVRTKETIDWWGLFFVIASEVVLTVGTPFLDFYGKLQNKVFVYSGFTTVLVCYWAITFIIATLFSLVFREFLGWFLTIEITIIAVAAIASVSIIATGKVLNRQDMTIKESKGSLQEAKQIVLLLKSDEKNRMFLPLLERIYEALHYANIAVPAPSDQALVKQLYELQRHLEQENPQPETIETITKTVLFTVKKRNLEAQQIIINERQL